MNDENVLCIYDKGDNDGYFSAAIIKKVFPDSVLAGWRFGDKLSLDELEKEHGKFTLIVTVDLPLFMPVKEWSDTTTLKTTINKDGLLTHIQGREILWFDHHASNEKDVKNAGLFPVAGRQDTKWCSAKNAYDYFVEIGLMRDDIECIKYVDTYDTWKKEGGLVSWKQALNFNFGMQIYEDNENPEMLVDLFINDNDEVLSVLEGGEAIRLYIESNAKWAKDNIEICEFEGYAIKFLNATTSKSYMADLLNTGDDILAIWSYTGEKYLYSLRTKRTDVDLSEIARLYGGGGHKQAAGFATDTLVHKMYPMIKPHR